MLFKEGSRLGSKAGWTAVVVAGLVGTGLFLAAMRQSHAPSIAPEPPTGKRATAHERAQVAASYGNLPLSFEPNQGQTDPEVKFLSRSSRYDLFLTANEAVFTLPVRAAENVASASPLARPRKLHPHAEAVLRMEMLGANRTTQVEGESQLAGHTNYIIGRDASKWTRNVPQFAHVNYHGIYPGVDLTFYGQQRELEFDFIVKPGASPAAIALGIDGAKKIATDQAGDLVLTSAAGDVRLRKPVAYQKQGEQRQPVNARFVVKGKEVALAVGEYDRSRELVIDPSIVYSTYLGGNSEDDGFGIAVDSTGSAYITGQTFSNGTFPKKGGLSAGFQAPSDAFVTKLSADGTALVYSTYLGGTGDDSGNAIALDASKQAYIVGSTTSTDFPAGTGNAPAQPKLVGGQDAFVAEMSADGTSVVYSTYIGGLLDEVGYGVALDASNNIVVVGSTKSSAVGDFPTTVGARQAVYGGGNSDGFVTKINGATGVFLYSSFLGGSLADVATGVAVDPTTGNIYVTGVTLSTDFTAKNPGVNPAFQNGCGTDGNCNGGQDDSFVVAQPGNLGAYIYNTYLGGSGGDDANEIAVDSGLNAYVVGITGSSNFPTKGGIAPNSLHGTANAYVTKLNPTGTALVYSTYLGGSGTDDGLAIALDSSNNAYVTGYTTSSNFPTSTGAPQTALAGGTDAFVSELNTAGASLMLSTYLGGSKDEDQAKIADIALDTTNPPNIYVTGQTISSDFPTIPNSVYPNLPSKTTNAAFPSPRTAFVVKYTPQTLTAAFTVAVGAVSPKAISRGSNGTSTVTVTSTGFVGSVSLGCRITPATTKPPTCAVTTPVALANGTDSKTATLTITTSNTGATSITPAALWLPFPGLLLAGTGLFGNKKRRLLSAVLVCLAFTGLLLMMACGSGNGGGGGGGGGGGTTTGSYTVTVTGAANGTNTTQTADFTVQ
ncbi:MAG TPA: SBBP repeat-containing protein [Terriglobales bacterium]|nr:SBBP repeat-containing protein [Terriglobales bacterium]